MREGNYDLVIADPFYKLHRGDSNDERAMTDLMRVLDAWRERLGFALVIPAHLRKPLHERRNATIHDIAGSAAICHGAETVVIIQRLREGVSRLRFVKDRDGDLPCGTQWQLRFDPVRGFSRDLDAEKPKETAVDKIRAVLKTDGALSREDIEKRTDYGESSVKGALKKLGCTARLAEDGKTKLWSLPEPLEAAA